MDNCASTQSGTRTDRKLRLILIRFGVKRLQEMFSADMGTWSIHKSHCTHKYKYKHTNIPHRQPPPAHTHTLTTTQEI